MRNNSNNFEQVPARKSASLFVRLVALARNIAVVGTIVSSFATIHWIADLVANLRVQFAILFFPSLVLASVRRERVLAAIVCGFFLYSIWPTIPYFLPPSRFGVSESSGAKRFRVLSFNVLRTNEKFESTLNEILAANADFVFLMEVQNDWARYLEGVQDRYPYQRIVADPGYTGVAFLSKHPWSKLEVVVLGEINNPSIDVSIQCHDSETGTLRIIATHPLPPFGEQLTNSRDKQLRMLAERFKLDEPSLMIGDFNMSPWSPRFASIFNSTCLADASIGYGISPTLDPLPTWFGGIKVDHVFKNRFVQVHHFSVQASQHSDHKMIVADFSISE